MPSVVVHAMELSRLLYSAPSAQDIDAAFQRVDFGGGTWGGWVGPRPRITRRALIGSGFETHAAYLYSWPDSALTRAHNGYQREQLLAQVRAVLAPLSADWTVSLENYAPAVNGTVAWWAGGQASITQTRDEFPTEAGRLDAAENPTGPTTTGTHPTTTGQVATGIGSWLSGIAWPLAITAGAVAAMYFLPGKRKRRERRSSSSSSTPPEIEPSRARARNPRPPEWDALPPDTLYRCQDWESGLVGETVPGRGGGTVSMCATPHEPVGTKRRRGQVQVGLPGLGHTMKKSTARGRIRRAGLERFSTPREQVAQAAEAYERETCPVPGPVGLEFPHTLSRHDLAHPLWREYRSALEDATEHASIVAGDAGPDEFACAVREALSTHPQFAQWDAVTAQGARGFLEREKTRRGKAGFSTAREAAQHRQRAISAGVDVTSAEYRDTLGGGEGTRPRRRRRNWFLA